MGDCKINPTIITNGTDPETVPLAYDEFEKNDTLPNSIPIILMHGLFWNKFMLKELGQKLNEITKRKVFSLDLRNHDQSPSCQQCDIHIMTEDVKRFLQDHNLKKACFVCHSFSSTIAYLIALDKPEMVEKIVMIDHAPFADFNEKILKENVFPQFNAQNRFLRTLDANLSLMDAKKKILSLISLSTKGQEYFLRKVAYELEKQGNKFKWKTDIEFLMNRYSEQAFVVKPRGFSHHPILIVRCNDSVRVNDFKFKEVVRHNPNAKLETIDGTTHLLHIEKMDTFVEIVNNFLKDEQ